MTFTTILYIFVSIWLLCGLVTGAVGIYRAWRPDKDDMLAAFFCVLLGPVVPLYVKYLDKKDEADDRILR